MPNETPAHRPIFELVAVDQFDDAAFGLRESPHGALDDRAKDGIQVAMCGHQSHLRVAESLTLSKGSGLFGA
jgi:hypothetical protein